MKKRIITIFTIFLLITSGANFVSAENITEDAVADTKTAQQEEVVSQRNVEEEKESKTDEEEKSRIGETVKSKENGHFNITFDDGYNGYCINYGDHEAKVNDEFEVKDTTSAINNKNGESIGHYLKTFFVEFHDIAVKNKIDTQKIIWAFSDDFDFNKVLVQQIKDASVNLTIPDQGAIKIINETTEAIFDFEVLGTSKNNHQNFFGYKITYRDIPVKVENNTTQKQENTTIPQQNITENKTTENTTIPQQNITENKTIPQQNITENKTIPQQNITENKTTENTTISEENETENTTALICKNQTKDLEDNTKSEIKNNQVNLLKHTTGAELAVVILTLIFGFVLVGKYYKRD
ncbi:hypothetical protein [Methanobrevibacter sp.]|uniref:hypothetical protein n=1 Tax=Methanobrevibacter sp. TaxID=66852 RepID=UPI00386BDD36